MSCPFCDINKEKTRILAEKKYISIIFSNPRLMPGHLLITPKRHVERLSELDNNEQEELFATIVEYQEKILKNVSSGCDIRQNYRPFQKQDNLKVNHLHIHLQPRELYDELYKKSQIHETEIFEEITKEELERTMKLIK
jgi:diadenosine tetraphosphate (Ap4A) HIT family hydrolase